MHPRLAELLIRNDNPEAPLTLQPPRSAPLLTRLGPRTFPNALKDPLGLTKEFTSVIPICEPLFLSLINFSMSVKLMQGVEGESGPGKAFW